MATIRDRIIKAVQEQTRASEEVLQNVFMVQAQRGIGLGQALIEQKIMSEDALQEMLVEQLEMPSINLEKYKIDDHVLEQVPEKVIRKYNIVPLSVLGDVMTVATADPLNVFAEDDLRNLTGKQIDLVVCTFGQIQEKITDLFGAEQEEDLATLTSNIDVGDFEILSEISEMSEEDEGSGAQTPIIRMVNLVIREALNKRASDIHMEPMEDCMRIRYRIDGVLQDILEIPKEKQNATIVRLKIMAKLDITASQIPQDGRFKLRFGKQEVDFRVSLLPTSFGQKVVMRVLDRKNLSIGLEKLGMSPNSVDAIDEAILKPFGMILVTGPTGSGKSTTLYSIINKLNTIDKNIITIEDPVEYLIEGLTQIDVKADIGLTFVAGLRAVLRQSPDIVMVGEIRDNETADIAIKASLTGQLVFSTLHTNDAAGSLTRLVDMGVEPFLVASSLLLICAQRLCRKICPNCKKPIDVPEDVVAKLGESVPKGTIFYEGEGCDQCNDSGYRGRFGITEVLKVDDDIREMLLEGKSSDDIKAHAKKTQGMKTLWEDAVSRCIAGDTTIVEVLRIAADEL